MSGQTQNISLLPGSPQEQQTRLSEAEWRKQVIDWNKTWIPYPADACIHQLFEAQVERTPDTIAVIFADRRLTYRELNRQANHLAYTLREKGVGAETLVGLCVERGLDMLIGVLGILKAGGAYVPLDPSYPSERLTYMLEDSRAPVLVTQKHLAENLSHMGLSMVYLDRELQTAGLNEKNLETISTPDNLAYVIYTSGSTGRPKGVQIPHRAVVNFLTSMEKEPGLAPEDTWLAVTTLSFDIAALELFLPVLVGARVVIAGREIVANSEALIAALKSFQVTVMQATPVTWRILLAAGWQGDARLKVLCGGEAMPLDLAQQLLPKVGELWNMYGPTETTIWSSVCKIEAGEKEISVGRPIGNTQMYLLDEHLHPVPAGEPAELYIGGTGVARGYYHRPELTAERFLKDPFRDEPGARIYKTGDLARYQADGKIVVIGRIDQQVKIRGFRIELGEIETVISRKPEIEQCVVVAREDTPGDKRLVAYLIPGADARLRTGDLRKDLMKQLPEYMVPAAFVQLETFPLTPNGKVDRKALPQPDSTAVVHEDTYTPAETLNQKQVVRMMEEILHQERVGIDDNFFLIGGNSLLATQLVAKIGTTYQIDIPPSALFDGPTARQVAVEIGRLVLKKYHPEQHQEISGEQESTRHLEVAATGELERIVAIQKSEGKRPFFFLHGQWTGDAFYCYPLARSLGEDQPFYLVEPYRLEEVEILPTLDEVAAAHIRSMRTIQPEGPYLLGGWCNGGLVAYEMARQLHEAGEQVDLLVLMEPVTLEYPAHLRIYQKMLSGLGTVFGLDGAKQYKLYLDIKYWMKHTYYTLRRKKSVRYSYSQGYSSLFDWVALRCRTRALYPGKIVFFWSSSQTYRAGWRHMEQVNGVEIHMLPGDHDTCRTDYLHVLAEHLKECVQKAVGKA